MQDGQPDTLKAENSAPAQAAVALFGKPEGEGRWSQHDADVVVLLRRRPEFIVYLDKNFDVDWENTDEYAQELRDDKINVAMIQGRITCLEAIPVDHLPVSIKRAFRSILGEAMCAAFEKKQKDAEALLEKAEEFISARNHEHARQWYVWASSIATAVAVAATWIVMNSYVWIHPDAAAARVNIAAAGIGGSVGALLSILLRIGRAPLDPAAGKVVHRLEGTARVCVGIIGATIVLAAIRAGLFLPQLKETPGIVLACLVAGASERLASTIIERVEGALTRSPDHGKESGRRKKP
jgi:hypothetical protein